MPQLAWLGLDRDTEWVTGQHALMPHSSGMRIRIARDEHHQYAGGEDRFMAAQSFAVEPQDAKYQLEIPEKRPDSCLLALNSSGSATVSTKPRSQQHWP